MSQWFKSPWAKSILISLAIHGLVVVVLALPHFLSSSPAQIASTTIDVSLVGEHDGPSTTSLPSPVSSAVPEPIKTKTSESKPSKPLPTSIPSPQPNPAPATAPHLAQSSGATHAESSGKSNAAPASTGTLVKAAPNLHQSPPPVYPERAKSRGMEGVVMLSVDVDSSGHPTQVSVKKSSGSALLDEAAVKAVWKWTFYPAKLGPISVSSTVEVPVRFHLSEN